MPITVERRISSYRVFVDFVISHSTIPDWFVRDCFRKKDYTMIEAFEQAYGKEFREFEGKKIGH